MLLNVKKKLSKMKTKSFFVLLFVIVLTSLLVWLFNSPQPHLKSIVSKTQLQIKNINSKLQVLDKDEKKLDSVDSTYLELLGFGKNPKLFVYTTTNITTPNTAPTNEKQPQDENNSLNDLQNAENVDDVLLLNRVVDANRRPPLISAFLRFTDREKALIESKMKLFFNDLFIIYDLDLSSSEQLKVKKLCNSSCVLKPFKSDKYPRHLVDQKIKAYKPIIIQEILNQYGCIIWIEPPNVFTSSRVEPFVRKSLASGILAWPLEQPITQMTHPSMFKFLQTELESFHFIHLLDTSKFILYNTRLIHENLMLPWVKCALQEDCIAPPGSKFNGCEMDRRPTFLYSGCHRYEMSAFSILVAKMFAFDENAYTLSVGKLYDDEQSSSSSLPLNNQKITTTSTKASLDSVGFVVEDSFIQNFDLLLMQNLNLGLDDKTTRV